MYEHRDKCIIYFAVGGFMRIPFLSAYEKYTAFIEGVPLWDLFFIF